MSCQKKGNTNAIKHSGSKTRLYHIWVGLSQRRYKYQVDICDEWRDFEVFREWSLSSGYDEDLTIDRIDPRKGYSPSNCQWITLQENSGKDKILFTNEQKIQLTIERKSLKLTQREFAKLKGVSRNTIQRAEKYYKNNKNECLTNNTAKIKV